MGILVYNSLKDSFDVDYSLISKKIYKLLPIYEGKIKGSDVKVDKSKAYENFIKNLDILILEVRGILSKIEIASNLPEVYVLLEGLKGVDKDSHDEVRNAILHCTNLLSNVGG